MRVLMTAWRLMFNSWAARSNSLSMGEAKSTFTLRIGSIIRPELVKKRETSSPRSARRAIASAEVASRTLRVCFIELSLLLGCFPQRHKVVVLAFSVFPNLEDDTVQ